MPFEKKIIETRNCPRCNAKAELRIDQHKTNTKWILVYCVCNTCKLNKYMYTTTRKAIALRGKVSRIKRKVENNPVLADKLSDSIKKLENSAERAERSF